MKNLSLSTLFFFNLKSHKIRINSIFLLALSKKSCTFATVIKSTLWDCVFLGWAITRHNKGVITRFVLGISEPGKF